MRVLAINAESGLGGGPAIIVNDICHMVNQCGGETLIAYGRQGDPGSGLRLYRISSKMSLYWHVLMTRLFDRHGLSSRCTTKRLLKAIDMFKPDIVNIHNIHGYYINYKMLFHYLSKKDIPIVWTLHDCWAFTGHCAYFDRVNCSKWKKMCYECPQKRLYPSSLWIDRSKRNFLQKKAAFTMPKRMVIVTPSIWLQQQVRQSFLRHYPIHVIHNGIDLEVYHPSESDWRRYHGLDDKKIILGVAAGWTERKGLFDFIKLSGLLGNEYQVVLVGVNEAQMSSLPAEVMGIKRTENRQELVEIYTAADIFVNTSIEDNFPTVILEALACGTPVVTYDTGGSGEALEKEFGRKVKQGDIAALKQAIEDLLKQSNKKKECLNHIQKFEKTKKYLEYVDLFQRIMEKG